MISLPLIAPRCNRLMREGISCSIMTEPSTAFTNDGARQPAEMAESSLPLRVSPDRSGSQQNVAGTATKQSGQTAQDARDGL